MGLEFCRPKAGRSGFSESTIERLKQALAGGLSCNGAYGSEGIWQTGDARPYAAISITNQHPSVLVHRCINEVEQVAVLTTGGALQADRPPLYRIIRSCVHQRPGGSPAEGMG